jgi:Rrf2 family transcriptional regulator, iron-sulfur cluster assembly transcription factor
VKLTTKGRFAVDAVLDIAIYSNNSPVPLQDISKRQNISVSYLEQLFIKLRKYGLVKSYKGPGGGYKLAKSHDLINIADVIKAVEDDLDARSCHGIKNCRKNGECLAHNLWSDLTNYVFEYLDKITINDIIKTKSNPEIKTIKLTTKNKSS